ncbi:MAG TPA: hypothetical protein VGP41_12330 [Candidatus Lustribacter sp.]|jgi:hypothetical protein|nr:hypothetical protein [Candidatus Lustribacter sp.]
MATSAVSSNAPVLNPPPLPYSAEQNVPSTGAPPGSIGHQSGAIASQLVKGNPGGAGVAFGVGLALDVPT